MIMPPEVMVSILVNAQGLLVSIPVNAPELSGNTQEILVSVHDSLVNAQELPVSAES